MHVTIRELQGLGFLSGTREADSATRMRLHNASIALANEARTSPVNRLSGIPSRADMFIAEVNSYAPWPEESWCLNCYGNTTMIRNNFFMAKNEAARRMGDATRMQISGGPSAPTNLLVETGRALPGAVVERGRELARGEVWTPEQRAAFGGVGPVAQRSTVSIEAERAEALRAAQERERVRLEQEAANRRDAEQRARLSSEERARAAAAIAAASSAERNAAIQAQQQEAAQEAARAQQSQQAAAARAQQEATARAQAERSRRAQEEQATAYARLQADRAYQAERAEAARAARERASAAQRAAEEQAAGEKRQIAVGLVSSITNAAASVGSAYAQAQADRAIARASRPKFVPPPPMIFQRPAAQPAGMDQTQMVMIGVGVAAVAGVGLILALRSDDDDED